MGFPFGKTKRVLKTNAEMNEWMTYSEYPTTIIRGEPSYRRGRAPFFAKSNTPLIVRFNVITGDDDLQRAVERSLSVRIFPRTALGPPTHT